MGDATERRLLMTSGVLFLLGVAVVGFIAVMAVSAPCEGEGECRGRGLVLLLSLPTTLLGHLLFYLSSAASTHEKRRNIRQSTPHFLFAGIYWVGIAVLLFPFSVVLALLLPALIWLGRFPRILMPVLKPLLIAVAIAAVGVGVLSLTRALSDPAAFAFWGSYCLALLFGSMLSVSHLHRVGPSAGDEMDAGAE